VLGALSLSTRAGAADFVGPETCKACHSEAFAAWRGAKHARALESLTPEQQTDVRCLSCHSPDLGEQEVAGVSCETCHGAGQYYSPAYVMKDPELSRLVGLVDPSERGCRNCHDDSSPSLSPFNFAEKLKMIDHWTAERERRKRERRSEVAPADQNHPRALASLRAVLSETAGSMRKSRRDRP
jgi:hypothetical protein